MTVMRRLRRSRGRAATRSVYFYDCAHPRMNAALKAAGTHWHARSARRWTFFDGTRWNENNGPKVQALRCWYGVAGNAVKLIDKSAAKGSHPGKRVDFTAAVLNLRRPSHVQVRLARLVSPFVSILRFFKLGEEFSKGCVAVTDARAVAEHSIESGGVAIVEQSKLLVTLNGAGSETQQSHYCERRQDYGAKTKSSFHGILNLLGCARSLAY